MPDILDTVASGAGIVSLSALFFHTVARLKSFCSDVSAAPEELGFCIRDLEVLGSILRDEERRLAFRPPSFSHQQALESCREAHSRIEKFVRQLSTSLSTLDTTKKQIAKINIARSKAKLSALTNNLDTTKITLLLARPYDPCFALLPQIPLASPLENDGAADTASTGNLESFQDASRLAGTRQPQDLETAPSTASLSERASSQLCANVLDTLSLYKNSKKRKLDADDSPARVKNKRFKYSSSQLNLWLGLGTLNIIERGTSRNSDSTARIDEEGSVTEYVFASWLLSRRWSLTVKRMFGTPNYSLRSIPCVSTDSEIMKACAVGDLSQIKSLFTFEKASPFDTDEFGHTLLYVAIRNLQIETCEFLLALMGEQKGFFFTTGKWHPYMAVPESYEDWDVSSKFDLTVSTFRQKANLSLRLLLAHGDPSRELTIYDWSKDVIPGRSVLSEFMGSSEEFVQLARRYVPDAIEVDEMNDYYCKAFSYMSYVCSPSILAIPQSLLDPKVLSEYIRQTDRTIPNRIVAGCHGDILHLASRFNETRAKVVQMLFDMDCYFLDWDHQCLTPLTNRFVLEIGSCSWCYGDEGDAPHLSRIAMDMITQWTWIIHSMCPSFIWLQNYAKKEQLSFDQYLGTIESDGIPFHSCLSRYIDKPVCCQFSWYLDFSVQQHQHPSSAEVINTLSIRFSNTPMKYGDIDSCAYRRKQLRNGRGMPGGWTEIDDDLSSSEDEFSSKEEDMTDDDEEEDEDNDDEDIDSMEDEDV